MCSQSSSPSSPTFCSEGPYVSNAIRVKNLTKTYRIYPSSIDRALSPFRKSDNARKFSALKNVTADFPEGEVIAILG